MSTEVNLEFSPKNMPFRRLGSSGLRVPIFALGGFLEMTSLRTTQYDPVKEIIITALEHGCNMFDTAESYMEGKSELEIGRAIKELGLRRSDIIISTKIYFGTRSGPNDSGLSRKHIIEGTKESLVRLQLDYVDIIYAHRPDPSVPIEEVVRAFNWVIERGWAFYWGTSEWSAHEIEEAHHAATKLGLMAPVIEQCEHHMFCRERPEKEYSQLYKKYGIGTAVWSALAGGLLTGKYNEGIPADSRFKKHDDYYKSVIDKLQTDEGRLQIEKVRKLTALAEDELGCKVHHLALAWTAAQPNTSTVILGASKPEQILDNFKAIEVLPKLTGEMLGKIEEILGNRPSGYVPMGRPPLD